MTSLLLTAAGVYMAFGLSAFLQAYTTGVRARRLATERRGPVRGRGGVPMVDREFEDALRWAGVGVALHALAGLLAVVHSLPS